MTLCARTGKRQYITRRIARRASKHLGDLRVYRCGFCGEWHTTKGSLTVRKEPYRRPRLVDVIEEML